MVKACVRLQVVCTYGIGHVCMCVPDMMISIKDCCRCLSHLAAQLLEDMEAMKHGDVSCAHKGP